MEDAPSAGRLGFTDRRVKCPAQVNVFHETRAQTQAPTLLLLQMCSCHTCRAPRRGGSEARRGHLHLDAYALCPPGHVAWIALDALVFPYSRGSQGFTPDEVTRHPPRQIAVPAAVFNNNWKISKIPVSFSICRNYSYRFWAQIGPRKTGNCASAPWLPLSGFIGAKIHDLDVYQNNCLPILHIPFCTAQIASEPFCGFVWSLR